MNLKISFFIQKIPVKDNCVSVLEVDDETIIIWRLYTIQWCKLNRTIPCTQNCTLNQLLCKWEKAKTFSLPTTKNDNIILQLYSRECSEHWSTGAA